MAAAMAGAAGWAVKRHRAKAVVVVWLDGRMDEWVGGRVGEWAGGLMGGCVGVSMHAAHALR